MNASKLKEKIFSNGMSIERVASSVGISKSSLYRKLNSTEKVTIGEALKLKEILELSDTEAFEIFLDWHKE